MHGGDVVLDLDQLTIRQGDFSLAANWRVSAGEKLAVIGPSGGGKSTLLSVIAGLTPPTTGRISIAGHDISMRPPGKRPLTLLFQEHNLFPHLTVRQNVALGVRTNLRLSADEWAAVSVSLGRVGLSGTDARLPRDLSGGQRQRVALARALIRNQPLLLLDEPFAALGPALRSEMLDLVDEIVTSNNLTLIMVTHQPQDATRIATQVSLVADGIAHAPRPTEAFFRDPPKALTRYLGT